MLSLGRIAIILLATGTPSAFAIPTAELPSLPQAAPQVNVEKSALQKALDAARNENDAARANYLLESFVYLRESMGSSLTWQDRLQILRNIREIPTTRNAPEYSKLRVMLRIEQNTFSNASIRIPVVDVIEVTRPFLAAQNSQNTQSKAHTLIEKFMDARWQTLTASEKKLLFNQGLSDQVKATEHTREAVILRLHQGHHGIPMDLALELIDSKTQPVAKNQWIEQYFQSNRDKLSVQEIKNLKKLLVNLRPGDQDYKSLYDGDQVRFRIETAR